MDRLRGIVPAYLPTRTRLPPSPAPGSAAVHHLDLIPFAVRALGPQGPKRVTLGDYSLISPHFPKETHPVTTQYFPDVLFAIPTVQKLKGDVGESVGSFHALGV